MEAALEVVGRRRDDGPGLDRDGRGATSSSGGSRPRDAHDAARDRDPDRGVAVGAVEALGGEELGDPGRRAGRSTSAAARSRGRPRSGAAARRAPRARSAGRPARGASRTPRRPAGTRGRTRRCAARRPGRSRPSTQTYRRSAVTGRVRTSTAPIDDSGPRALATVSSHSAAGSLRHVIPPPTWRVSRSPSATNVRMRISSASPRPAPASRCAPQYGPRRTGSSASISSIARIFGAPVIEPPGNEAARRSNASRPGGQPPGHGGDEVLDGRRPLEPQSRGTRTRARLAHPAEVVAQDVDDHHVLGLVLGAREQLAGQRPVLVARRGRAAACP